MQPPTGWHQRLREPRNSDSPPGGWAPGTAMGRGLAARTPRRLRAACYIRPRRRRKRAPSSAIEQLTLGGTQAYELSQPRPFIRRALRAAPDPGCWRAPRSAEERAAANSFSAPTRLVVLHSTLGRCGLPGCRSSPMRRQRSTSGAMAPWGRPLRALARATTTQLTKLPRSGFVQRPKSAFRRQAPTELRWDRWQVSKGIARSGPYPARYPS